MDPTPGDVVPAGSGCNGFIDQTTLNASDPALFRFSICVIIRNKSGKLLVFKQDDKILVLPASNHFWMLPGKLDYILRLT
jgi:hypothetical protein